MKFFLFCKCELFHGKKVFYFTTLCYSTINYKNISSSLAIWSFYLTCAQIWDFAGMLDFLFLYILTNQYLRHFWCVCPKLQINFDGKKGQWKFSLSSLIEIIVFKRCLRFRCGEKDLKKSVHGQIFKKHILKSTWYIKLKLKWSDEA